MPTTFASEERRTMVQVRLSQIPIEVRQKVASDLVESWGLSGVAAILFGMWAASPRQDPVLTVSAEKAAALLERGARPAGATPRFEPPSELLDTESRDQ